MTISIRRILPWLVILLLALSGCSSAAKEESGPAYTQITQEEANVDHEPEIQETEEVIQTMKMKIGETEVPVVWEENDSVNELKAMAEEGPLTIAMSKSMEN